MCNQAQPDDSRLLVDATIDLAAATAKSPGAERLLQLRALEEAYRIATYDQRLADFEDKLEQAPVVTVFEYVGRPRLIAPADLAPADLGPELVRIFDLLADNQIYIDFLTDVEDAEAYRFLVEDLMAEEIRAVRVEGWNTHFVYEEFFPDKFDFIDDSSLDDTSYGYDDDIPF